MKKNITRLLAALLALIMVFGLVACGEKTPEPTDPTKQNEDPKPTDEPTEEPTEPLEPYTLTWFSFGTEQEGTADVIEAVNELLAEVLPNTTLEMAFHGGKADAYNMALAGGEKIDIAWEGYFTSLQKDMADGNLLALDDLINEYAPNIAAERDSMADFYKKGTYEGVQYAIPCAQPVANESKELFIHAEWAEYFDMEAIAAEMQGNLKTTQKLLDLLDQGLDAAAAAGKFVPGKDLFWISINDIGGRGYAMFNANCEVYVDTTVADPKPILRYEIPEYIMVGEMTAKWYEKGYISESQIVNQMPEDAQRVLYFNGSQNRNWSLADEHGIFETTYKKQPGYSILANKPEDGFRDMLKVDASNIVIPYTSENPERAMMFLNLLHDEPGTVGNEIYNMLCLGFAKGSAQAEKYGWYNYELVEQADGTLLADETVNGADYVSKHEISGWAMGNQYLQYNNGATAMAPANVEYCKSFMTEVAPNMRKSPIDLMYVDIAPVSHITDAMKGIVGEQKTKFNFGVDGVDSVKAAGEAAVKILYDAGAQEVIDYLQAEIDEYMGK